MGVAELERSQKVRVEGVSKGHPRDCEVTCNDNRMWSGGTAQESVTRVHVSGEYGDMTWSSIEGIEDEQRVN